MAQKPQEPPLQYNFIPEPGQDDTKLVCEAKLHVGQEEVSRNTCATLCLSGEWG